MEIACEGMALLTFEPYAVFMDEFGTTIELMMVLCQDAAS